VQALRPRPSSQHIRTREANGRELSYLEGWYAISEANRIFGFDGWSRETLESRPILTRENRGTFLAVYMARVRVTVQADGATVIREGHGTGEDRGTSQPRAIGLKVSDEFTVPLCRGHHRQLHQAGNEVGWWKNLNINALEIAKGLWEESRMKTFPTAIQSPPLQAPTDPPQAAARQDASKLPNEPN
jgi:Rad52/22 family double-strand break repair protein